MAKKKVLLDASKMEIGQKVNYGMFSDITFKGLINDKDEELVIMEDSYGNTKRVFRYLFEKYAKIINE